MTDSYPKRLIEVDLPIARISAHARREKSIRHGHISTLHIWWARRPLAACRAVICAALWPDPADEHCPHSFREAAVVQIKQFATRVYPKKITGESKQLRSSASQVSLARWEAIATGSLTLDKNEIADMPILRQCLLDFIADFANWDNSTVPAYLDTSRALTQAAHEALGGLPGTRPLVVDPFAGGGSIPLESLRVGADAFASDLNPVAVLLNKVVLEYIPKYGQRLADEVCKWGQWVKERAQHELADFYPKDPDGATPIAYLWARTILSEAPGQGEVPVEVPMLRSMWLAKSSSRDCAIRWVRDEEGITKTEVTTARYADGAERIVRRPMLEVFWPSSSREVEDGTVARGSVTCPVTGYTTSVASVRSQLKARYGGAADARMIAVRQNNPTTGAREYRNPRNDDIVASLRAIDVLSGLMTSQPDGLTVVPDEEFSGLEPRRIPIEQYGIKKLSDLFSPRQLLSLITFCRHIRAAIHQLRSESSDAIEDAVHVCLSLSLNRLADFSSSLCVLNSTGGRGVKNTFARQALPMVWDFMETNPLNEVGANWDGGIAALESVIEAGVAVRHAGQIEQVSATAHLLPDDSADAIVTDPPYYFSVPYADLSDFFYVWTRRTLAGKFDDLLACPLTPKADECIQNLPHSRVAHLQKDRSFFESSMRKSLAEARRVARPTAVSVVVFAHMATEAWEAMLASLLDSGWCVTGSWPIDTERAGRIIAQRQSTLGSSVHLVCRPRENLDGSLRDEVGEWRDVLAELPSRIHEWMPRLAAEGVVGADAIFACLGPALEIFSRYSRVEKASGDAVPLREYLEQVWAAVSTEALSMIFEDADAAGLEPDARLTAMWLWTLGSTAENGSGASTESDEKVIVSTGYTLEFDAARKIAQGLGVHLERSESIVEVKGDKARLLPISERTRYLFGQDEATAATARGHKKKKVRQRSLFEELNELEAEAENLVAGELKPQAGETVLDRVHQSMILFASGRGEALRRFLVDDGAGNDARFWKLAQSLSALYPKETDEKRWVDGVLARKKGLGL